MGCACQACREKIKDVEKNGYKEQGGNHDLGLPSVKFATKKEILAVIIAFTFGSLLLIERWFIGFQVAIYMYATVDLCSMILRYSHRKFAYQSRLNYQRNGSFLTGVESEVMHSYAAASNYYNSFDDISNLSHQMDQDYVVDYTFKDHIMTKLTFLKYDLVTRCNPVFLCIVFMICFTSIVLLHRSFMFWVIS